MAQPLGLTEKLAVFFELAQSELFRCGLCVREHHGQTIFPVYDQSGAPSSLCFYLGKTGADVNDHSQWTEFGFKATN